MGEETINTLESTNGLTMEIRRKKNKKYWTGEYANKGEYYYKLNSHWPYLPVYLAKLARAKYFIDALEAHTKILDAGCGEGVLLSEYTRRGYNIVGMDLNYSSNEVFKGDILNSPFATSTFDVIIDLDVIEHFSFRQQEIAIKEFARILKPGGYFFLSVPNLAHFISRIAFLFTRQFVRTSEIYHHPGDRPMKEYLNLLGKYFHIRSRDGILPTFPILSLLTVWKPFNVINFHKLYNKLIAYRNWCFLNIIVCEKKTKFSCVF